MYDVADTNIDGCAYRITKFPARKGFKLFADLGNIAGPALAEVIDAGKGAEDVESAKAALEGSGAFAKAAKELFKGLDSPKAAALIDELAAVTMHDPDGGENHRPLKPAFDTHFSGNLGAMIKWIKWSLEAQFGNLFEALSDLGLG